MKIKSLRTALAAVSIAAASCFATAAYAEMIWVGDFETGNLSQYKTKQLRNGKVVSSPVRDGKKALTITLRRGQSARNNSEVMPQAWKKYPKYKPNFAFGQEYWYSVSIHVPKDYVIDEGETVFQFHASPDTNKGDQHVHPPLALGIENGKWYLRARADGRARQTKGMKYQFKQVWSLGKVKRGGWTDWVFRIKWSYKSDGLTQVWRDGQLVVNRKGMNTYNDSRGPYLKLGIYKNVWNQKATAAKSRTLSFDAVKIYKGSTTVKAMRPKK